MPSTTISRGNIIKTKLFQLTLTPSQVAANTTSEQAFTCIGLNVGDYINGNAGVAQTPGTFIVNVRASALNTVAIQFCNVTGGALTPVSGVYGLVVVAPENLPLDTNAL